MIIDTADRHSECVTQTCTSHAQIQMIHTVVGKCFVIHSYRTNHNHTWPIATAHFSPMLYTTVCYTLLQNVSLNIPVP